MDQKKLLKLLNDHKVNYVIIGGVAVIAHGYTRTTEDIDIFIEPTRENATKALEALKICGYDISDVSIDEALEKKLLFRGYILKTDIHPKVTGIDFQTIWKNKIPIIYLGEATCFASLDDLITMKKAAGRDRDIEDLKHLEEIRRQLTQKTKI